MTAFKWSPFCRQQTRISAIEAELQRLQREMAAIKLENQALKAKVI